MYRKLRFARSRCIISFANCLGNLLLVLIVTLPMFQAAAFADAMRSPLIQNISLQQIDSDPKGGFAYRLVYHVPASIEKFWRFKTDFNNEILLTSRELIEHRVVKTFGNSVITENRYATAPGLRFMWQTTVIPKQYRLEFKLLNAKECRHRFHYGTIQLSRQGDYTKVTQIAYFDFSGASLWVKYPWYGGMKSTLTKVAKWEQQIAEQHVQTYLVNSKYQNRAASNIYREKFEYLGGPTY